jgi:hypothetical protein
LDRMCGRLSLREVENSVRTDAFSGGGGGNAGEGGRSGRERGLWSGSTTWKSINKLRQGKSKSAHVECCRDSRF